ncbi:hypothetical protein WJX75_008042 [Coccomyxa subellipsoidea]|uniref:Uncharacterized protein n=1 Tax=Coccomyxa subellipsoidea TaxID=248742 RepID=A0ABR2Z1G9_9CHLO
MKGYRMDILLLSAVAFLATGAHVANADCSDRSYNCVLSANVVFDKTTGTATQVDASCTGDPTTDSADCTGSVGASSSDNTDFMASGTSAGSITLGSYSA